MNRTAVVCTSFASLAILGSAIVTLPRVLAGPLDPPSGSVSPTYKTLAEVEPRIAISDANTPGNPTASFIISSPGSYYFTSDLAGEPGKDGIRVLASDVSIDLNGFMLRGVPGTRHGIVSDGFRENISVRNGTVRDWALSGVELMADTGLATRALVENIRAISNARRGISVPDGAIVRGCIAASNGTEGIRMRSFTGGLGKGLIEGCAATDNAGLGILAGSGGSVNRCVATFNGGGGIGTLADCVVAGCVARGNTGYGISIGVGATVRGCVASGTSGGDGIVASGNAMIADNNCTANSTGAGIRVAGARNRIEGNQCAGNSTGVLVTTSANFIVRNTCAGNSASNWNIAANNVAGPILDRTNPANFAINGNSGPSSLGSTDPNANFSY